MRIGSGSRFLIRFPYRRMALLRFPLSVVPKTSFIADALSRQAGAMTASQQG